MQEPIERVTRLAASARQRNTRRLRVALIIALLVAALLLRGTWPWLRPGLFILLAGYLATALLFLFHNARLAPGEGTHARDLLGWFDREQSFLRWSGMLETVVRSAGFLVLGYGFWLATRSSLIALLLGLGYPAITYFAVDRRNNQQARQNLQIEKEAMASWLKSTNDGRAQPV